MVLVMVCVLFTLPIFLLISLNVATGSSLRGESFSEVVERLGKVFLNRRVDGLLFFYLLQDGGMLRIHEPLQFLLIFLKGAFRVGVDKPIRRCVKKYDLLPYGNRTILTLLEKLGQS